MTRLPRLAPVFLRPLLGEAARLGLDVPALLRGLSFTAVDLETPWFRVSYEEAFTVVRRALQLMSGARLGLELGQRTCITHCGALALGLLASPKLSDSLQLQLQFPQNAGFLMHVRALRTPEGLTLVAEPLPGSHDLSEFLVDQLFAGIVRLCRQVCDDNFAPTLVEMMRPLPQQVQAHDQLFRTRLRFNSSGNRLTMDSAWLNRALPMADAMSYRLAMDLMERESAQLADTPALSLAVIRNVRALHPRLPTQVEVASLMHLSERSLRRRLADEGTSFRALLDDIRRSRAQDLLTNSRRSMAEAAAETGFSDARSLRRALKRWRKD